MPPENMTSREIEQFLACARVGRMAVSLDTGPYIVPVGYAYSDGSIFFHMCDKGLKANAIKKNPNVCFEVDESLSDASMYKSVIVFGEAKIIDDEEEMILYLQKLINKYRVPEGFDQYMNKPGRNREKELKAARICLITPKRITGRKQIMTERLELGT
jgi:nitroimidazol reductase NimA-like FMN-containing flavoprotein (pyridoxamine 5'-phosphate oxidase superfamily)